MTRGLTTKAGGAGALLTGALLVALVGCDSYSGYTAEEHFERAEAYIQEDEKRSAAIELRNVLQADPDHAVARLLLGEILLELGDAPGAEKELVQARDLGVAPERVAPALAQALLEQGAHDRLKDPLAGETEVEPEEAAVILAHRARAHLATGEMEASGETLQGAEDRAPEHPAVQLAQAMYAGAQGDHEAARQRVRAALDTDAEYGDAWSFLASLERRDGNTADAIEAYGEAIAHKPNHIQEQLNRALLHLAEGDTEAAWADHEQAARFAPSDNAYLNFVEGVIHFSEEDYESAQPALERAVRHDRDFAQANFYLGATHFARGNEQQARRHLTRFQRAHPDVVPSAKLLAILWVRADDLHAARNVLAPIVEAGRGDAEALRLMAHINMAQADEAQGLAFLRQVAEQSPESAVDQARLGLGLMMAGQEAAGVEALEAAVALDPGRMDARSMLIAHYLRAERYEDALDEAESALAAGPEVANLHNLKGGAHLGQGDHEAATEAFEAALDVQPGFPPASHNLALIDLRAGRVGDARARYETVVEHFPDHLMTRIRLAHLEFRARDVDSAKQHLRHAVEQHPEALQPRVLLARHALDVGQSEEALAWLEPVAETHADDPSLLALQGEALIAQGQYEDAVYALNKLIARQPESFRAYHLMALAYAEMEELDQAESALEEALAINPDHGGGRLTQARLTARQGRTEEAYELAVALLEDFPDAPELHAERASLAARLGRYEEAGEHYRVALEEQPRTQWLLGLASAVRDQGNQHSGIQVLESWLEDYPNDVVARHRLADAYLELGDDDAARDAYRAVLDDVPGHVVALNNLAWLLREDAPHEALTLAERASELAPEAPAVLDTLGELLLRQQAYSRAIEVLERAAEGAPDDPNIRFHLARAYVGRGQEERARALLDDLLADSAGFEEREAAEDLRRQL